MILVFAQKSTYLSPIKHLGLRLPMTYLSTSGCRANKYLNSAKTSH